MRRKRTGDTNIIPGDRIREIETHRGARCSKPARAVGRPYRKET